MSVLYNLCVTQQWQAATVHLGCLLFYFLTLTNDRTVYQLFYKDEYGITAFMIACCATGTIQLMMTKAKLDYRRRCLLANRPAPIISLLIDTTNALAARVHGDELAIRRLADHVIATSNAFLLCMKRLGKPDSFIPAATCGSTRGSRTP